MNRKRNALGRSHWLPLVLPAAHFAMCVATAAGTFGSEGSWRWFLAFYIDFPFSILLLPLLRIAHPFLVFATLGTAWWLLVSIVFFWLLRRVVAYFRGSKSPGH